MKQLLTDEQIDEICTGWTPKLSKGEKALMQYGLEKARDIYEKELLTNKAYFKAQAEVYEKELQKNDERIKELEKDIRNLEDQIDWMEGDWKVIRTKEGNYKRLK